MRLWERRHWPRLNIFNLPWVHTHCYLKTQYWKVHWCCHQKPDCQMLTVGAVSELVTVTWHVGVTIHPASVPPVISSVIGRREKGVNTITRALAELRCYQVHIVVVMFLWSYITNSITPMVWRLTSFLQTFHQPNHGVVWKAFMFQKGARFSFIARKVMMIYGTRQILDRTHVINCSCDREWQNIRQTETMMQQESWQYVEQFPV